MSKLTDFLHKLVDNVAGPSSGLHADVDAIDENAVTVTGTVVEPETTADVPVPEATGPEDSGTEVKTNAPQ